MTLKDNLRLNLRKEMSVRGLSQSELSRRSGVRQATIPEALSGTREPSFETIETLAKVLDVNAANLFNDPPSGQVLKAS